jgi:hypothetical protein
MINLLNFEREREEQTSVKARGKRYKWEFENEKKKKTPVEDIIFGCGESNPVLPSKRCTIRGTISGGVRYTTSAFLVEFLAQ